MINQISIFLENKVGELDAITKVLADNQINIRALNIAETKDYGVLRIIVDDAANAFSVLTGANYVFSTTPVVAVKVEDCAGGLNKVLGLMDAAGVDIQYMYSMFGGDGKNAYMIFRVDNPQALEATLADSSVDAATNEELDIK